MNIFIVEDEHWALLEMEILLKKYEPKHEIFSFSNGEDAFEKIKEYQPSLVITDITMPGLNGLELVEKVKDFDPSIECILLTVHDTFEYAKKGIKLGVTDYLLKPINKHDLYDVIEKTITKIEKKKNEKEEKLQFSLNKLLTSTNEESIKEAEMFENQEFYLVYLLLGNWQAPISWEKLGITNNEIEQMNMIFTIMKIGLMFIGTIALIIASIGIYNTMTMAVTERAPDIGIMKAIGANPRTIKNIFLLESSYIGFLGAFFGTIVAYAISYIVNLALPIVLANVFDEVPPEGLVLSHIPLSLTLISVGICLTVTIFSGWRPAERATRIDVLKAMRREV